MDFKKILEYQSKDMEAFKIDQKLAESKHKEVSNKMVSVVKEMQVKSSKLEKLAEMAMFDFEKLKKAYDDTAKASEKLFSKQIDDLGEKELDNISTIISQITNNLNILEKKLLEQAEKVNAILIQYNDSRKTYNDAKTKYIENKKLYDEEVEKLQPQMNKIKDELAEIAKQVDPKVLEKYLKRKKTTKRFPIIVPLVNKCCNGCHMGLSMVALENIKKDGYIECDCGCIVYGND